MDKKDLLYQTICKALGKEALTDTDIHTICSFLQRGFGQPCNPIDLGIGEVVHVDANPL